MLPQALEQFISEALDKAEFGMAWSPWVLKKKRREENL